MKNKILYIDTETTGLDCMRQDIIQLAALAEIDGELVDEFEIFCQPYNYDAIDRKALQVTGYKIEDIKEWHKPQAAYEAFKTFLNKYIDKYDKADKFVVAGQNVSFDIAFVRAWASKAGDKYIGSYMWHNEIDLKTFTAAARAWGLLHVPDLRLETVCAALGVEITKAHNAMADIRATRECLRIFRKMFERFENVDLKIL